MNNKPNAQKKSRKQKINWPFICSCTVAEDVFDETDLNEPLSEIFRLCHSTEQLSASGIEEHVKQEKYFKADKHLIKLEYERYTNQTTEKDEDNIKKEKKEIESLYELLSAAIFTVVKESMSISKENPDLLKMAVRVKIQEEKADQIYLEEKGKSGSIPEDRPREWEAKWLSTLQQSVNERIGELPSASDHNKTEWLTQCLVQLRSQLKEDLDTIENNIKPCYPQEYNICEKYVEYYHKKISSHIALIAESGLKGKDVYPFLYWIYNCYPELIGSLTRPRDADEKLWSNLLPQERISQLEDEYISTVRSDAKIHMNRSLQIEEENWGSGQEPLICSGCYHSELHIDIIQIIDGGIRVATIFTCELGDKAQNVMLEEMICFLESFQKSVEHFEKKHLNNQNFPDNFVSIIISITNSCESFRDYLNANDKITNAVMKENILSILNEMEKRRKDVLLKTLFCKLKPYFTVLVTASWFSCQEPINNILKITEEHLTTLKKLKLKKLIQELSEQTYKELIKEYILKLMRKKLFCKTEDQQKEMANQIEDEAHQLQRLFSLCGSQTAYLEAALCKMAEIIRLQDTNAIAVEVSAFIYDFPDVKKHHISAILYIKGNMKKSDEKKILKVFEDPLNGNPDSSTDRNLFSTLHYPNTLISEVVAKRLHKTRNAWESLPIRR